jgi:hypothetical protein
MGRPTTASKCSQAAPVVVAGQPATVECTRGEGHKGVHQGPVRWAPRGGTKGGAPSAR